MADAYAKLRAVGVVVTTFEFRGAILDTILKGSAENTPLVLILGTSQEENISSSFNFPQEKDSFQDALSISEKIFRQLAFSWTVLDDVKSAAKKIDAAIDTCIYYQKPICIELPQEIVEEYIPKHIPQETIFISSDGDALHDALNHLKKILDQSSKPFIAIGRGLVGQGNKEAAIAFAERYNIPLITTILAKDAVPENHPLFLGMYTAEYCKKNVKEYLQQADSAILLGISEDAKEWLVHSEKYTFTNTLVAHSSHLFINSTSYPYVSIKDFSSCLPTITIKRLFSHFHIHRKRHTFHAHSGEPVSFLRALECIQNHVETTSIVIIDCEEKLLAASSMEHCPGKWILSPSTSHLFWGVPAAIAAGLASPLKKIFLLLSEASFFAQCTQLSSCIEHEIDVVCIVFTNRKDHERHYNIDLFPEFLGKGKVTSVFTEDMLEGALETACRGKSDLFLIEIHYTRK